MDDKEDSPKTFDTVVLSRQSTLNDPKNFAKEDDVNVEVSTESNPPGPPPGTPPSREKSDVNSPTHGGGDQSFNQTDEANKASSLVTQTDKDGNPMKQADKEISTPAPAKGGGILRRFFSCCFRGTEESGASGGDSTGKAWRTKGGIPDGPLEFRTHPDRNRLHLLGPPSDSVSGKKCLVLDLDETLVHSSFKPTENPDYIIPVEIDNFIYHVYVGKRPGVDLFLEEMGKRYEIVIYTASLSKYADPLLDKLDKGKVISHRLFRESCVCYEGNYVKDLSLINRDLKDTIIIDNSPTSYIFHPPNAIGCGTYIDDAADREMYTLLDFLSEIENCSDVRDHCHRWTWDYCTGQNDLNPAQ